MTGWDEALGVATVNEGAPTTAGLPVGLPMPRDRELLFDRQKRVHVTRRRGRRFPFPVPNSWFIVAQLAFCCRRSFPTVNQLAT